MRKGNATWSPSEDIIAFNAAPPGKPTQVWTMPASGGEARLMTSGEDRQMHFFYSPDGQWLYVQPNHLNIHRMPAEGGALEPVTEFPESGLFIDYPTISPDGSFLAYSCASGGSSLWLLTLDSGSP